MSDNPPWTTSALNAEIRRMKVLHDKAKKDEEDDLVSKYHSRIVHLENHLEEMKELDKDEYEETIYGIYD